MSVHTSLLDAVRDAFFRLASLFVARPRQYQWRPIIVAVVLIVASSYFTMKIPLLSTAFWFGYALLAGVVGGVATGETDDDLAHGFLAGVIGLVALYVVNVIDDFRFLGRYDVGLPHLFVVPGDPLSGVLVYGTYEAMVIVLFGAPLLLLVLVGTRLGSLLRSLFAS